MPKPHKDAYFNSPVGHLKPASLCGLAIYRNISLKKPLLLLPKARFSCKINRIFII